MNWLRLSHCHCTLLSDNDAFVHDPNRPQKIPKEPRPPVGHPRGHRHSCRRAGDLPLPVQEPLRPMHRPFRLPQSAQAKRAGWAAPVRKRRSARLPLGVGDRSTSGYTRPRANPLRRHLLPAIDRRHPLRLRGSTRCPSAYLLRAHWPLPRVHRRGHQRRASPQRANAGRGLPRR